jgi:cell division septal protein FtsQ
MTRSANPLLTRQRAKKVQTEGKVAKPTAMITATPKAGPAAPATGRGSSTPQQTRRRRQIKRAMRRFEATLATLPRFGRGLTIPWAIPRLGLTPWHISKALSLVVTILVALIIGQIHTSADWFVYRENVQFQDATYLNPDDLYQASGIDGWNVFWLQPEEVRQRLVALPYVADATVQVTLPNRVHISLREEQPVALWITQAAQLWLMPDGSALAMHDQRATKLLQIVDPLREAQNVQSNSPAIDPGVLQSALALTQQFPDLVQLRFNHDFGLNFNLPGSSAWVYWGDGQEMTKKFTNLAAVQQLISSGQENPQVIDVRYSQPYIR